MAKSGQRAQSEPPVGPSVLVALIVFAVVSCRPESAPVEPAPSPVQSPVEQPPREPRGTAINWGSQEMDMQRLERSIRLATGYMVRACDEEGRFQYLGHLDPEVKIYPEYNIVRHAGAMIGLAMAYHFDPRAEIKQALLRAQQFLQNRSLDSIPAHPELLAAWSRPEVTFVRKDARCKLGGTGLGLVALCHLETIVPGTTSKKDLRKLAEFLRFMQKPDGSFYAYFIPAQGGQVDSRDALYFAGEAALGLALLYRLDPDPEWLDMAGQAMRYLATSHADIIPAPPDQWTLQAAAHWLPLAEKSSLAEAADPIRAYVTRIARDMLADQAALSQDPRIAGCFARDGITCSTGTCLEGLLPAWEVLADDERILKQQLLEGATSGANFLLKSQVRHGPFQGAWTFITPLLSPDDARLSAAYQSQAEEVRIDYVQHPLCALVRYHELRKAQGNPGP